MNIAFSKKTQKNRIQDTSAPGITTAYLLTIAVVLCIGIISNIFSVASDFAQDYLAASAIRDGINPNLPLIQLAQMYGVSESSLTSAQNAHPPLVILFAVPFTYFPWETAHYLWHIQLSMIVGALWIIRPIRQRDLILLSPAWVIGMCIGNVDVVVICLCLTALSSLPRTGMAIMLGLAAALKVYPLLLIAGLCAIRQYRLFFIALISGAFLTLVATLYLGFSSLTGWFLYIPHNVNLYALNVFNISLTKLTSALRIDNFFVIIPGIVMVYLGEFQFKVHHI